MGGESNSVSEENAVDIQLSAEELEGRSSNLSLNADTSNSPHDEGRSSNLSLNVDTSDLPAVGSVRERFEQLSASGSNPNEFTPAGFHQMQQEQKQEDMQKQREARESLKGFSEMLIHDGKTPGVIDDSNLEKTFIFEGGHQPSHDGACDIQYYTDENYYTGIFVVHRTRGMLLLKCLLKTPNSTIPGGKINEAEFLNAAKQTGHMKMQLQLAAREGAARHLFEQTGIDVRFELHRLHPAVLRLDPPVDEKGIKYLKNEYDNRLYYFLKIDESDFCKAGGEGTKPEGEADSEYSLQLSDKISAFVFLQEPAKAIQILDMGGDNRSKDALTMIIGEASPVVSEAAGRNVMKNSIRNGEGKRQRSKLGSSNKPEDSSSAAVDAACCWPYFPFCRLQRKDNSSNVASC